MKTLKEFLKLMIILRRDDNKNDKIVEEEEEKIISKTKIEIETSKPYKKFKKTTHDCTKYGKRKKDDVCINCFKNFRRKIEKHWTNHNNY